MKPNKGTRPVLGADVSVYLTQGHYNWDGALTESETNQFPLADKGWVKKGLVTKDIYDNENRKWAKFHYDIMSYEVSSRLRGGHLEMFGVGLGRELIWVPGAVNNDGCTVAIRDSSQVACNNASRFIVEHDLSPKVRVTMTDVYHGWDIGEISDDETDAYIGSQFVQNQHDVSMYSIMFHFGKFLAAKAKTGRDGWVYLTHARGEDNPPGEVEWGNTTPYLDEDWQEPLAGGLGGKADIKVLGQHLYYSQKYTMFRIGV